MQCVHLNTTSTTQSTVVDIHSASGCCCQNQLTEIFWDTKYFCYCTVNSSAVQWFCSPILLHAKTKWFRSSCNEKTNGAAGQRGTYLCHRCNQFIANHTFFKNFYLITLVDIFPRMSEIWRKGRNNFLVTFSIFANYFYANILLSLRQSFIATLHCLFQSKCKRSITWWVCWLHSLVNDSVLEEVTIHITGAAGQ